MVSSQFFAIKINRPSFALHFDSGNNEFRLQNSCAKRGAFWFDRKKLSCQIKKHLSGRKVLFIRSKFSHTKYMSWGGQIFLSVLRKIFRLFVDTSRVYIRFVNKTCLFHKAFLQNLWKENKFFSYRKHFLIPFYSWK